MKTLLKSISLAVAISAAPPSFAASVFADFDGDAIYDPLYSTVPGAVFTARIYAELDNAHGGLTSYGVTATITPSAIVAINGPDNAAKLANVSSDPVWESADSKTLVPDGVDVFDSSLVNAPSGPSVHLFDVVLRATGAGFAVLHLGESDAGNPDFDGFVGLDGFTYDGELTFRNSEIAVVPLPPSLLMFAPAAAVLAMGRGKRARRV